MNNLDKHPRLYDSDREQYKALWVSEQKQWKMIHDEFPKKLQTRINNLKEKQHKMMIKASKLEIESKDWERANIEINYLIIQIRELKLIQEALSQSISEMLNIKNDRPSSNQLLEINERW